MVRVCDCIMGAGKSQGAIAYMNDNHNKKFVYITPYLTEAARIKNGCPDLDFVEPSEKLPEHNFSKLEHTKYLMSTGCNIATSHAAFRVYTADMLEDVSRHGYTLMVDESVDVFTHAEYGLGDVRALLRGNYIEMKEDGYIATGIEYEGGELQELFDMFRYNRLIPVHETNGKKMSLYYWALPKDVLEAFSDVFVFTYLFESQDLRYYMDINGIEYDYISVQKGRDGQYRLVDGFCQVPSHVSSPASKIHIFSNPKLNEIGTRHHDVSANWFKRRQGQTVTRLKNNLYNYFRYYHADTPREKLMWGTYKDGERALCGKGFSSQHVNFATKATNEYSDRNVLAYCANVFVKPVKTQYFASKGVEYNSDANALSTMVQWIWRSAIRNGEDIWIYIPSKRMRNLLVNWLEELEKGA